MHRALVASIVLSCLAPLDAQNLQFMPLAPRAGTPLLQLQWRFRASAVGDDFDGDGRRDLVVGTEDAGAVVLRGSATGWTQTSTLQTADQRPKLVDLDGDGDRDLAFVPPNDASPNPVLLFQNTPSGMVPAPLPAVMAQIAVRAAAVGDIDGNGFADLVVAAPVGMPVPSLVLVRGGPGLQFTIDLASMPAGLPAGLWPELLDADGDGDLDVLATHATSGLHLLQNVGGTFVDATATLPPVRIGHRWLAAADYDGDGRDDCAAALPNGELDVLWGAPSGLTSALAVATVPAVAGLWPADFDGDGDLDILAEHAGGLDVLWNLGLRQFARTALVTAPTTMRGTADIDGDGVDDVLFAQQYDDFLCRCNNQGRLEDAAFAAGMQPLPTMPTTMSEPGDFDGDGRTDFATLLATQIVVDHALGGGHYRRSSSPLINPTSFPLWITQLADMDRDGDLDFVVKNGTSVSIASNDGSAFFAWTMQSASSVAINEDLRLVDIDADGDLDIVLFDLRGTVLLRNGGGQYGPPVVVVPPMPVPACLELADIDGDQDLDVLVAGPAATTILANNGAGSFAPSPGFSLSRGLAPTSMRAGDFDGDGDQDLVVADSGVRLYRNNGNGFFTDTTSTDMPLILDVIVSNFVVADLDGDGDLDVGAITTASPLLLLLSNDGTGRFTDQSLLRGQGFLMSLASRCRLRAADYDDDGDIDLIAATAGTQVVIANHLRQCTSNALPRLGGVADLYLFSGPGFGQPGLGLLGVGFALAPAPLRVPGLAGRLELDAATLQVVAAVTTSPIGVSNAFVPVPQDPLLFGLQLWFQGAILPSVGQAGFTNTTFEVILR